jgi:hypothetical protein
MFGLMEPFMPRLLKRSGLFFHRLGRNMDYHGLRAVCHTDTRRFVGDAMPVELRGLYAWIRDEMQSVLPPLR